MVWPLGWVCHAVRAPGVKWTLLACRREEPVGVVTVSMYTAPVNHSFGPRLVSMEFLVICMWFSSVVSRGVAAGTGVPGGRPSPDLGNHLVGQPGNDPLGIGIGQHQDEVGRAGLDERLERRDRRREVVVVDSRLHRQLDLLRVAAHSRAVLVQDAGFVLE